MSRILLIFCISILLLPVNAVAQNSAQHNPNNQLTSVAKASASVAGYIKDAETGENLLSANIAFQETQKGISSDTKGYYTLENIIPGTYTIVCSYVGYEKYEEKITLKDGQQLRLDVELTPKDVQMDVVVQAESENNNAISFANVDAELIKNLPSALETDVFRSVQLLPGIKASSDFSSGLHIRGGSPDQTLILFDRTPIYNPTHFLGFFSTFNPDAVQNIQLFKGAYPAEYGGRLGSVLTIENKDGNTERTAGSVTAGMLASRVSLEGPLSKNKSKGSWMLAARRSTIGPLLDILRKNNESIPEDFYFYDINGKISVNASSNDNISLAVYSGQDRVIFPIAEGSGINMDYGNQIVSGNWSHIFSDNLFSDFSITGSRYFNYPGFESAGSLNERGNNIYDFSAKWNLDYVVDDNHHISGGLWAGNTTLTIQDRFDGENTFSNRINNKYASAFLQDDWRLSDQWKMTPGVRVNYYSNGDYLRVEPRWNIEFSPSDRLSFQASYGHYNQFLTLASNKSFSGFDVWLSSADGVPPASGDQVVLGTKTIPFKGYGLNVEVYYRTMNDLFELDPFLPDVAGLAYQDMFRFGEGNAYGVELFFEKKAGKFTGFLGYTYGHTWRKFPGYNVDMQSENQTARAYPPRFDRRHDVNLVLSYQLSSKWKATSSFSYATGQAYTEALGRYRTTTLPWRADRPNIVTVGKVNASRLPAYHSLDVAFSRTGRFFNVAESELQLQLINVYSRRNIWFYNYRFDPNPAQRNDVSMLPMLPSVSFTIKF